MSHCLQVLFPFHHAQRKQSHSKPSALNFLNTFKGYIIYVKLQLLKKYSHSSLLSHLFHNHYKRKKKTETKNGREQSKMIKFTKFFKK